MIFMIMMMMIKRRTIMTGMKVWRRMVVNDIYDHDDDD